MNRTHKSAARASQDREVLRQTQQAHDTAAISFMRSAQEHLRAANSIAKQLQCTPEGSTER